MLPQESKNERIVKKMQKAAEAERSVATKVAQITAAGDRITFFTVKKVLSAHHLLLLLSPIPSQHFCCSRQVCCR